MGADRVKEWLCFFAIKLMNRIFGTSKAAAPKPTLNDAISKTDERVDGINVKIRKLDLELLRYKEQMANMRYYFLLETNPIYLFKRWSRKKCS